MVSPGQCDEKGSDYVIKEYLGRDCAFLRDRRLCRSGSIRADVTRAAESGSVGLVGS